MITTLIILIYYNITKQSITFVVLRSSLICFWNFGYCSLSSFFIAMPDTSKNTCILCLSSSFKTYFFHSNTSFHYTMKFLLKPTLYLIYLKSLLIWSKWWLSCWAKRLKYLYRFNWLFPIKNSLGHNASSILFMVLVSLFLTNINLSIEWNLLFCTSTSSYHFIE